MQHILKNWLSYLNLLAILISAISSLRSFRLDTSKAYRYFSIFLFVLFIADVFGFAWPRVLHYRFNLGQKTLWLYNPLRLLSYTFYACFFYSVLTNRKIKTVIKFLAAALIIFGVTNMLFIQKISAHNSYTALFGQFLMIFISVSYYYQLLKAKDIIVLHKDTVFWISSGLLIYNLCGSINYFLIDIMDFFSRDLAKKLHQTIMYFSVLMYLTFTIAFLCMKKNYGK
jgi:hypothetical protein